MAATEYVTNGVVYAADGVTVVRVLPTVNGLPASFSQAQGSTAEQLYRANAGIMAQSIDPSVAASTVIGVAGQMQLVKLFVPVAATITNIIMTINVAGATLTSGQCFAGLFDINRNLLSSTADQSTAWAATGIITMALATPQVVQPGAYYVGFYSNGTTQPTWRTGVNNTLTNVGLSTANSRFGLSNTGLTTALPATASAITAAGASYFAALS